jgi:sialate O-acetylesterase
MPAAGPLKITIQGDNTITFQDVYIGEVWLCSGQSNMDMTVAREDRYWCGVLHEEQEVAAAKYPLIRFFDVAFSTRDTPQEFCSGTWEVVSPQTVGHMSAAAYFFAREILKTQKVAVGLLTSAYGASTAEAWTRREALEQNGQVAYLVNNYDEAARRWDSGEAQKEMDAATEAWSVISRKVMDDINFLTSIRECITCPESNRDTAAARLKQLRQPPRPARIRNPHEDQHSPSVLWNAMIQPLVPFGIRGAIWYQGESNGPSRHVYQQLMETLIRDWRRAWGQGDFPFLYVQLANIDSVQREPHQGNEGPYELFVREAQLRNLSVPHTAMAVAIDNADPEDLRNVHPKDKATIGYRLALAARALAYGEKNLEYMGPVFSHVEIKGNEARLFFKHTGKGLMARDGLKGFAIAGQDRIYHWGQARIEGNAVVVTHPDISRPAAVRYGWARNPVTSLYNKDGLPASPFRTE